MTIVPQVRFLDLIVAEAQRYPSFRLVMGARVEALLKNDDGHIHGVRYRPKDGWHDVRTQLVVGADGRLSRLRSLARLEAVRAAARVDVLWFRLPRQETDPAGGLYIGDGGWVALQNRGAQRRLRHEHPPEVASTCLACALVLRTCAKWGFSAHE